MIILFLQAFRLKERRDYRENIQLHFFQLINYRIITFLTLFQAEKSHFYNFLRQKNHIFRHFFTEVPLLQYHRVGHKKQLPSINCGLCAMEVIKYYTFPVPYGLFFRVFQV